MASVGSPLVAARAGETIEMVDVVLGSHHHLESRYGFATGSTITCRPKQSKSEKKTILHVLIAERCIQLRFSLSIGAVAP